jgi:peptidoglycan/xylan/chitin deacetylase (PgdA/CDA1 family)
MHSPFPANLKPFGARPAIAMRLKELWCPLAPDERFAKLAALRRHLRVDEETRYPPLTWRQIREMREGGIRFGSHTVYHSILPKVDQKVVAFELRDSKRRLESVLQESCALFAYPDGKHNELSTAVVKSSGYKSAVTQDFGCNQNTKSRLLLKRIEIPFNDPMPSFRGRVSLALPIGNAAMDHYAERARTCAE